jgi:hypothetical protein
MFSRNRIGRQFKTILRKMGKNGKMSSKIHEILSTSTKKDDGKSKNRCHVFWMPQGPLALESHPTGSQFQEKPKTPRPEKWRVSPKKW